MHAPIGAATRLSALALTFGLVAALSACGGGSSGNSNGGSPVAAPVSNPPPPPPAPIVLQGTMPVDGTGDVAPGTTITAHFNAPLVSSTVTAASVQLVGPKGNAIPAVVTTSGNDMAVTPTASGLPSATTYTVKLAASIADADGGTLAAPASFKFTTAASAWPSVMTDLAPMAYTRGNVPPAMIASLDSDVLAAWVDDSGPTLGGTQRIEVSRADHANGQWSPPTTRVSAAATITSLQFKELPNGDAFLLWSQTATSGTASGIYLTRYFASGKTWSSVVPVSFATPELAYFTGRFVPLVDHAGNLTIVVGWYSALRATRLDAATGTWHALPSLEDLPPADYDDLSATIDASDAITVAWGATHLPWDAGLGIYAARFADGVWSTVTTLAPPVSSGGYISLAVQGNAAGAVVAMWSKQDPAKNPFGSFDLWSASVVSSTGEWSTPAQLNTAPVWEFPAVVIDAAGDATAAWMGNGLTTAQLDPASGKWSAEEALGGAIDGYRPALSVDVAGNVFLFAQNDSLHMFARRLGANGGTWSAASDFAPPSGELALINYAPASVVDGSGTVTAAWATITSTDAGGTADKWTITSVRLK